MVNGCMRLIEERTDPKEKNGEMQSNIESILSQRPNLNNENSGGKSYVCEKRTLGVLENDAKIDEYIGWPFAETQTV